MSGFETVNKLTKEVSDIDDQIKELAEKRSHAQTQLDNAKVAAWLEHYGMRKGDKLYVTVAAWREIQSQYAPNRQPVPVRPGEVVHLGSIYMFDEGTVGEINREDHTHVSMLSMKLVQTMRAAYQHLAVSQDNLSKTFVLFSRPEGGIARIPMLSSNSQPYLVEFLSIMHGVSRESILWKPLPDRIGFSTEIEAVFYEINQISNVTIPEIHGD